MTPAVAWALRSVSGLSIEVMDELSYEAALRKIQGEIVELVRLEPYEDEIAVDVVARFDRSKGWSGVVDVIRRGEQYTYMNGDCWHLALALARNHGLDLVAVVNERGAGSPNDPDPDSRPETVGHVAARLPDGRYIDVRGILETDAALCLEAATTERFHIRDISVDEIVAILDAYAAGTGPGPWNDPAAYEFAERTDRFVSVAIAPLLHGLEPAAAIRPSRC